MKNILHQIFMFVIYIRGMKKEIQRLHKIAEYQKKLAWYCFDQAKSSVQFKNELLAASRQAALQCRELRAHIRKLIGTGE